MESHTRSAFADLCVSWLFIRIALVYPADAFAGMADEIRSFHQVARALCPGHVSLYLEVPLGASDGPVFLSIAGTAPWMDGVDADFTFFLYRFSGVARSGNGTDDDCRSDDGDRFPFVKSGYRGGCLPA